MPRAITKAAALLGAALLLFPARGLGEEVTDQHRSLVVRWFVEQNEASRAAGDAEEDGVFDAARSLWSFDKAFSKEEGGVRMVLVCGSVAPLLSDGSYGALLHYTVWIEGDRATDGTLYENIVPRC